MNNYKIHKIIVINQIFNSKRSLDGQKGGELMFEDLSMLGVRVADKKYARAWWVRRIECLLRFDNQVFGAVEKPMPIPIVMLPRKTIQQIIHRRSCHHTLIHDSTIAVWVIILDLSMPFHPSCSTHGIRPYIAVPLLHTQSYTIVKYHQRLNRPWHKLQPKLFRVSCHRKWGNPKTPCYANNAIPS